MNRLNLIRTFIFLATTVGAWGLLSMGGSDSALQLEVGQVATRDYEARFSRDVENTLATEELLSQAADAVPDEVRQDPDAEETAFMELNEVIGAVTAGVIDPDALQPELLRPDQVPVTTDTTEVLEETATTEPVELVTLTGRLYLDVDGDGILTENAEGQRSDTGLDSVNVRFYDANGVDLAITETGADGRWTIQVPAGIASVAIDPTDVDFPQNLTLSTANSLQGVECAEATCEVPSVGYRTAVRLLETQVADLQVAYPVLRPASVQLLAAHATEDVVLTALGERPVLLTIGEAAGLKLTDVFGDQVTVANLNEVRDQVFTQPPIVLIGGTPDDAARDAAADLVAMVLLPNYVFDQVATEVARDAAQAEIDPVMVSYQAQQEIVRQGQILEQLDIDAIRQTGALSGAEVGQSGGLMAVLAAMVACLGFYLARFRPEFWTRPRMAALLGLLVVLAAGAVRLTIVIQDGVDHPAAWYVLPGVVFGLMAAVLFDSRVAALMAFVIAVLAATGTRDPGVATYGLLSAMVPVGFVSSLSSRGSYRKAVLFSSVAAAGIAAAVSWFFHTNADPEGWFTTALSVGQSAALALGVSLLTALLGLAALQFLESAFDITTSLRLLELTDRNHDALVLLQEKAFGSFNHSLMVGTLADAAARAVGADPLLARAAAYYHDLGKTQNPTYFIENQFGAQNPHDDLDPRQSVEMIRRHVTDGVELARKYKIPTEVAEGIVTHHGDGIMRYFYEKARRANGEEGVDPNDFRHIGHKPRTAEMAIVMLADSLEAACRAVFRDEEPTAEAIEKVVNRVVDEKVNDGQLSESSLTLAQLTKARRAFLEALVGHYHQRIAYPNFPGS
jgi:putative nucleotidyltransferase with HDIG domain